MSTPEKEKIQTDKEYLKASAPVNPTGKNSYGVSPIPGEKIPKKLHLNKDSVRRLMEIAQATGLTPSDVVELAIREYIEKRSQDQSLYSSTPLAFKPGLTLAQFILGLWLIDQAW
ncbi:MAG: ribbon-helix-helix protein, CopG family [Gomphosphaeria aponina SAG 52.96 = DSM 107014]|uniref:Ribbon-helix-helix protein, CopG family n=1 Tax=Gomphosphaeria aponina SAG 52.96 = DSM 107014 TaxID=1521640 RepID=A0A941GTH0_9CHRO|nr:ribbon-helix-helix protein, CopG family [Gomphosphaeria aponina SAG 52.96 = DSM 107014]